MAANADRVAEFMVAFSALRPDDRDEVMVRVVAEIRPGPLAEAWTTTVGALYADMQIDATSESSVTQGAVLSRLLDLFPLSESAPKWHSELRQVRRELIGDDESDSDDGPAGELVRLLGDLSRGPRGGAG